MGMYIPLYTSINYKDSPVMVGRPWHAFFKLRKEARMSASAAPTSRVPLPTITIEPPKLVITVPRKHPGGSCRLC